MSRTFTNQSTVSYDYEGATSTKTNTSNIVTSTMNDRVSFSVEKTSLATDFSAGDVLTYLIHVTNTGSDTLNHFTVSDNLGGSDLLSYVDGTARLFIDGTLKDITPTSTDPLEFVISETVVRDQEFILMFNAMVESDVDEDVTEIENSVTVRGCSTCGCGCDNDNDSSTSDSESDENRRCHTETATLTIPRRNSAELLITKSASRDNFSCGDEFDYFITLTNNGNLDASNVVVKDKMPDEFTLTEVHMENGGNHYMFNSSEYDVDDENNLTVPNATGTAILVPTSSLGRDNSTVIRIHGHF